ALSVNRVDPWASAVVQMAETRAGGLNPNEVWVRRTSARVMSGVGLLVVGLLATAWLGQNRSALALDDRRGGHERVMLNAEELAAMESSMAPQAQRPGGPGQSGASQAESRSQRPGAPRPVQGDAGSQNPAQRGEPDQL